MKRRLGMWAVLTAAAAMLLLEPGGAWACVCEDISARATYQRADATFVGVATSTERVNERVARTMFAVSHVWKGEIPETIPVETGLQSDDCPFEFVPGARYAIFAEGNPATGLRTDSCAHPSDLEMIERAGLSREDCASSRDQKCVIARYDVSRSVSPGPLAVDGPGVGGPGAPKSGPIAAAGVLLLASAIGTYAAYRSRGAHPGGVNPAPR